MNFIDSYNFSRNDLSKYSSNNLVKLSSMYNIPFINKNQVVDILAFILLRNNNTKIGTMNSEYMVKNCNGEINDPINFEPWESIDSERYVSIDRENGLSTCYELESLLGWFNNKLWPEDPLARTKITPSKLIELYDQAMEIESIDMKTYSKIRDLVVYLKGLSEEAISKPIDELMDSFNINRPVDNSDDDARDIYDLLLSDNRVLINAVLEGFQLDRTKRKILSLAIHYDNLPMIRDIIDSNYLDINYMDEIYPPILVESISKFGIHRNLELINYLIEKETINVNLQDYNGYTALILATSINNIEIVKLLLQREDIAVNSETFDDNTALMFAIKNNNIEIVKLLLKREDIAVNLQTSNGYTALMVAIEIVNNIAIVKLLLLREDLNLNLKNANGYTALMIAIEDNNIEKVKLLLKREDIDLNLKNDNGYTALMLAKNKNYSEIIKLISKTKSKR